MSSVLPADLQKGMTYRVQYIGPTGGDQSRIGDKKLLFNGLFRGPAIMPIVFSFIDKSDEQRYIIPHSDVYGPLNVGSKYTFTETYTGPMASGYGPNARRARRALSRRKNRKSSRKSRRNTRK
jgi:hypothetical protein